MHDWPMKTRDMAIAYSITQQAEQDQPQGLCLLENYQLNANQGLIRFKLARWVIRLLEAFSMLYDVPDYLPMVMRVVDELYHPTISDDDKLVMSGALALMTAHASHTLH